VDTRAHREPSLIAASRDRRLRPLVDRDRAASLALAASFVLAAVVLQRSASASVPVLTGAVLLLVFLVASTVEFEIGSGVALATEIAVVPMFVLLPPADVPLLIAAATLLHRLPEFVTGRLHAQRAVVLLASCWYAIGPALVLTLSGTSGPSWANAPIYLAALAAQIGFDLGSTVVRETVAHGEHPLRIARTIGWVYLVDVLLAPIGFYAAIAAAGRPGTLLLLVAPCALLAVLARDRRKRIDQALALSQRYERANRQATQDSLTGLANRRAWEQAVREIASDRAAGRSCSVIIADLDDLKAANDTYGHTVGDELLAALGALIATAIRDEGLVARVGGDEIGILLPDVDELACRAVVRRLRERLRTHPGIGSLPLRASVGHATTPPAADLRHALELADSRMYANKHRGSRRGADRPRPAV
jgi:diguanylate cyclase (GGDEF)-like protein